MKTKIQNPKTEYLLGAGLNVLHQESREWQKTISFWKDETKFFANLLKSKEPIKSEYGKMLKNLDSLHETLFDYLSEDIVKHENLLSRLVKGEPGISDDSYRNKHKELSEMMASFNEDFIDFKKMVFSYVKKI